jgi:hypothetical protein
MMKQNLWTLYVIQMFFVACTSTDSTFVATSQIYAELSATAEGNGRTEVEATLRVGGPLSVQFVDLEGGDLLRAILSSGTTDITEVMDESQGLGVTWYSADFGTEAEDTQFRVEFDRETETSAMNSNVTLPAPFLLSTYAEDSPAGTADNTFYRGNDTFEIRWDPYDFTPGDLLSYQVAGLCIKTFQGNVDWDRFDVLQIGDAILSDADAPNNGANCSLDVTITLSRTGTVDPAFDDGAFLATQVRTITVQSLAGDRP